MSRTMDVVPYDPNWVSLYQIEKELLKKVFGTILLDIEHFGSTSVNGLSAKPIIDIIILVNSIESVDEYNTEMEKAGYIVRGENGVPRRRYFVKLKPDGSGNHTYHVHVYEKDDIHAQDEVMFRDYLRIDSDAREEYQNCKLRLSKQFYHNPLEYIEGKTTCISGIMEKAKLYFINKN